MADLEDLDLTAPADSLYSGGVVLNTWRARIDVLNDALGDITSVEADQIEAIGTTTVSAAQWGYLGACVAGGGQLLAALTASESTQLEAIGATTISAAQWGYLGACVAGGGQLLAALTAAESTQLEAIGTTTISATQWGYLGALNQGLTTTSTVTFGTINAFTLGGKLTAGAVEIEGSAFDINGGTIASVTLDGAIAGGDQAFTGVGDMTFTAGSLLRSGVTGADTLLLAANDTTFITLTTGTPDTLGIGAFTLSGKLTGGASEIEGSAFDINGGTIASVTLDGAIAGGDQAFTNVGDMTFATASLLKSGGTNTNTLLIAANDTTFITLTTADPDTCAISGAAIDNCIIGAGTPAALTCTTFTSTGIDDNADATAITISVTEVVSLGAAKLTVGTTTPTAVQWGFVGDLSYGVSIGNVPAFLVFKNTPDQDDIAINEDVTVTFAAETYDIGGNFATNTFTAPVTGKYYLDACVRLEDLDQAATYYAAKIITSNRTYSTYINMSQFAADVPYWSLNLSVCADMDATDTAYVAVYQSGGAVQTDFFGHATVMTTYFSGVLVG